MSATTTKRNGVAATMVTDWMLPRALSPPDTSRVSPMAAVSRPHRPDNHGVGVDFPPWEMEAMTVEAESAEVMK